MNGTAPIGNCLKSGFTGVLVWTLLLVNSGSALSASTKVTARSSQASLVGADPIFLGSMGNFVYFTAQPSNGGAALFKSDGTAAGTTQVAPIDGIGVLTGSNVGTLFISTGTEAYFLANTTAAGQQVWITDGTSTGTHQVADPYTGSEALSPTLLGLIGTDLIFAESTSDNSMQLFRTDGTTAGTQAVSAFASSQYGMLADSAVVNGKVYVALESNLSCCQPDLWSTDGTAAGTVQIDSNEGYPFHLQPSSLRPFGNQLALLTDAENTGTELSMVDSDTNALTILDLAPGAGSGASNGSTIAAMDGFILFLRGDPNDGLHLYRSDGTLAGTTLVTDLGAGVQLSQLSQDIVVTRVGARAIFQSENAQNGPQLWGSDGTAAGTVPLINTPNGPSGFYVQPLIGVVGSHAYYGVYSGSNFQLVATDGTAAGTYVLTDLGTIDASTDTEGHLVTTQVAGDDTLTFIYVQASSVGPKHLYAYAPQTNVATHLADASLIDANEQPLVSGGILFFMGSDATNGVQPWVSDGTAAGTHILMTNGANLAPVAANDAATSTDDAAVTINVTANDTDSGGTIDPTSVQIVSQPAHGTTSTTSTGSVVYTPTAGYAGSDSFTYTVKDNQGAVSNVATVTLTVTAAAQPPPSSGGSGGSSGGGGGGGSLTLLDLLALSGILVASKVSRRFAKVV
jgi:trimeric autotransporter adhesin